MIGAERPRLVPTQWFRPGRRDEATIGQVWNSGRRATSPPAGSPRSNHNNISVWLGATVRRMGAQATVPHTEPQGVYHVSALSRTRTPRSSPTVRMGAPRPRSCARSEV